MRFHRRKFSLLIFNSHIQIQTTIPIKQITYLCKKKKEVTDEKKKNKKFNTKGAKNRRRQCFNTKLIK